MTFECTVDILVLCLILQYSIVWRSIPDFFIFIHVDERLLRIFLKILEPLMPYIQKINDESLSETKPDTATSAGECAKGDNNDSNQEPTTSTEDKTKEEDLDGEIGCNSDESDEDEMSEKSKQLMVMLYQVLQGFTFDVLFSIHVVSRALNDYRCGIMHFCYLQTLEVIKGALKIR